MTLFAVSVINWYDNELKTEFYSANHWRDALAQHSAFGGGEQDFTDWPLDQAKAKQYAFDQDMMIEVIPVPTSAA